MALAIDGSSPTGVGSTAATQTTASFTAPSGSIIVALAGGDGNTSGHNLTFSDSIGGTWVRVQNQNGTTGGHTGIATCAANGSARTVSVVNSDSATSTRLQVYVVTGNTPTAGASFNTGASTSTNVNMTGPTTTHTNTICFWAALDYSATGTASSSDLTIVGYNIGPGFIIGSNGYKTVATASTPTGNYNNSGGTNNLNWTAIEIYEAGGAAAAPRPTINVSTAAVQRAASW